MYCAVLSWCSHQSFQKTLHRHSVILTQLSVPISLHSVHQIWVLIVTSMSMRSLYDRAEDENEQVTLSNCIPPPLEVNWSGRDRDL